MPVQTLLFHGPLLAALFWACYSGRNYVISTSGAPVLSSCVFKDDPPTAQIGFLLEWALLHFA